ncbi:MAG: hypothetical protein DSZ28_03010 [Thiothrix sp.]|nr:MAG: hypothetical protein DSZ28_03010 [Thiothrix sp.]
MSIAQKFEQAGLVAAGDEVGSYIQSWQEMGGESEREVTLKNIIGVIPAAIADDKTETIVIGAHWLSSYKFFLIKLN